MTEFVFPTPPKTYKKVKAVKTRLVGPTGLDFYRDVTVYMHPGGTPTFAVAVPEQYMQAWKDHRSSEYDSRWRDNLFEFSEQFVHATSFDQVIERLQKLSHNWKKHYESISIRKVIQLNLELRAPPQINHNSPSFSESRILVGVRSGIYWEVNGQLYTCASYRFEDIGDDEEAQKEPKYEDLHHTGRSAHGTVIPFSDAAWQTVRDIERTLERAADMLLKLTGDNSNAQLLLEAGAAALLGHSPTETQA